MNEIRLINGSIESVEFGTVYFVPVKQKNAFRNDACARGRGEDGREVLLPIFEGWHIGIGPQYPELHSRLQQPILFARSHICFLRSSDQRTAVMWGMRHSYEKAAAAQHSPVEVKQQPKHSSRGRLIRLELPLPETPSLSKNRVSVDDITIEEAEALLKGLNRNSGADNSGRFKGSVSRSSC